MLGPENPVKISKWISNYQAMYAYKHTYLKKIIYVYAVCYTRATVKESKWKQMISRWIIEWLQCCNFVMSEYAC